MQALHHVHKATSDLQLWFLMYCSVVRTNKHTNVAAGRYGEPAEKTERPLNNILDFSDDICTTRLLGGTSMSNKINRQQPEELYCSQQSAIFSTQVSPLRTTRFFTVTAVIFIAASSVIDFEISEEYINILHTVVGHINCPYVHSAEVFSRNVRELPCPL